MSPCFLLLDNIDVLLGLRLSHNAPPSSSSSSFSGKKVSGRSRRNGARTSHQAIDRVLSALLVELDGISIAGGGGVQKKGQPRKSGKVSVSGNRTDCSEVIVIATASCSPEQIDRYLCIVNVCIYSD